MSNAQYVTDVFTGIRPTGGLTVANYLGAVKPIIELQEEGRHPLVFVADLHALTDNEPKIARKFTEGVVADYLALGVNPDKADIFIQSHIQYEISLLTVILSRLISVSELIRIPTLKDKIKDGTKAETANAMLMLYPVMMAADILIQRAKFIPVGEDQIAHIEISQKIAERFNKQYGNVFPRPEAEIVEALRILSLKGEGKMSKSNPQGAVFLTDDVRVAEKKIKKAQTGFAGEMNPQLESHIIVAKGLTADKQLHQELDAIIEAHQIGENVMGKFKQILAKSVTEFLTQFHERRQKINLEFIQDVLVRGNKIAKENASETMELVLSSLY